ncbi:RfbB [Desulforapulum autotrophicum HRM2]|uniref:dTDP-glucose 4,6-dehydratase n=1 Tax=Desulforapulum autotrophicum (strain ATCC 43914 / DSM 3382 / VKM B-1955 / HRM2) TaxID=177437 RepID=C0QEQ7_DESAH|nr:dTDP-glucose 4,6-dehydratase [Desulforapulum autotrophicum]ACN15399.1 RfbB [Desulforapulum autotrophicum HRM2]
MKNVLVTGGCGFIGSNFIRYLLGDTDFSGRVINVDKLTYAGNPASLEDVAVKYPDRYIFEKLDICDAQGIQQVFERYAVDTVCHFAAESHVDRSIASPEVFVDTNIKGTFTLLEASRVQQGFSRFHHVSTDEVYGSLGKSGYFVETTSYAPSSPYSASKAASDHLVRAYCHTYGLDVTISNCSNNYGPFQFPEKLIPLMILNALGGKPLPIYGDGSNIRDWLYVRDHCRAIWMIMERGRSGETYNVGGECEVENRQIVYRICDLVDRTGLAEHARGSSRDLVCFIKDRPGHDFRYAIDCTKLKNELGWRPEESFETGMEKSVAWYLDHLDWVRRIQSGEYLEWIKTHYNG